MPRLSFVRAIAIICLLYGQLHASVVIGGDSTTGQTFSFPVAAHIYEKVRGLLFVGAQVTPSPSGAAYAISYADQASTSFTPLVSAAQATVNGVAQANPLNGAAIPFLSFLAFNTSTLYPVAVTATAPGIVYFMQNGIFSNQSPFTLLSTGTLLDATGNPTPRIASMTTNLAVGLPDNVATRMQTGLNGSMAVFAAVTNDTGIFGNPGSGIATAVITTNTTAKTTAFSLMQTVTLDINSSVAAIQAPLAAMQNSVILSNYVTLSPIIVPQQNNTILLLPDSMVYVGLQVQAAAAPGDGAYGVLTFQGATNESVGNATQLTVQTPALAPIVTSSAVTADSIVAAIGSSAAVNIYTITNMKTTTLLRYLIVVGGVAPYGTQRTVFAMPLDFNGQLADVTSTPSTIYGSGTPAFLVGRTMNAATKQGTLYTSTMVQAIVGGGQAPGDVTDIITSGDTVFASIVSSTTQVPGIFYSQALFAANGLVQGWTQWQRAGNATSSVAGLALDEHVGNFWSLLSSATGSMTITRTLWEAPQQGVQQFLQQQFSEVSGGMQGVFDIPAATAALDQASPLSVTIATGNNCVVIAQSGQTNNGMLQPVTNFSSGFTQTNGTLEGFAPGVTSLTMSGGALATIGAIIAATIVTDGTNAWFAVAGAHGVAILARPDGTGWLLSDGLQNGFVGLTADMQWTLFGTYQAVRKLVANQNALYVLTQTTLERVALSPAIIQQPALFSSVVLAQASNLPGGLNNFFSDCIVCQKVGLLATSSGLLRGGNGTDVTAAMNAEQMQWTPISFQNSVGPVTRLFGISATGLAEDLVQVAPLVSGNVYVLNAYVGYDQTRVYRLTINYTGEITDTTIQQLPDIKLNNTNTFFLTFGRYRNQMTTDGAIFSVSRSRYLGKPTFMELLDPSWVTGDSTRVIAGATKVLNDETASSIGHMIRSSVTGAWLVPGEFGLFVNE